MQYMTNLIFVYCFNFGFLWHRNCLPSGTCFFSLSEGFFRSERMIFSGSDHIAKIMPKKTKVETLY